MGIFFMGVLSVDDLYKVEDFVRRNESKLYILEEGKEIIEDGILYKKQKGKLVVIN